MHRSGTSLLASLLASTPDVAGLEDTGVTENEGHWLHREYPSVETYGGPGRFAFDSRSHLTDGSLPNPAQSRRRIEAAWDPFWSRPDAPVRVEKSPQNLLQSRLLQEMFPDSAFVMVARHPVTVAFATQKWTSVGPVNAPRVLPNQPLQRLVRHWLAAWEQFEADRCHLKSVSVIRFEDLMSDTPRTLGTVAEAIQIDSDFSQRQINPRPTAYQDRYQSWQRSVAGRIGARGWMRELEPALNRFGYSFADDLI